jgi:hypothetical protein
MNREFPWPDPFPECARRTQIQSAFARLGQAGNPAGLAVRYSRAGAGSQVKRPRDSGGRFDIGCPRAFVRWRLRLVNLRFEIGSLFDQDRGKSGVLGRVGEFEKRCRLTHEIPATDHDATPSSCHPARYITWQVGIRSTPKRIKVNIFGVPSSRFRVPLEGTDRLPTRTGGDQQISSRRELTPLRTSR